MASSVYGLANMARLIAENLTYCYSNADEPALKDVSIELNPGTLTALVGPNGAGKSTLLRLLQGQSKPNGGQVTIDGNQLNKKRFEVSLMPQRTLLNWSFPITVEGLVGLGSGKFSQLGCCELEAVLQRVGIAHLAKRRLDSLSGGQQQKALLAKTLMTPATTFLLDEPCAALDPLAREEFLIIIRQIADAGATVFVSSHDWGKSLQVYDKVVAIDKTVLAYGSPQEVQTQLNSIDCMSNYCCG